MAVESADGTAVGSRVRVETSDGAVRTRVRSSRSTIFSRSSRTPHLGLGPATVGRNGVVRPDGTEQVFADVETVRRVRVTASGSLEYAETGDGER